MNTHIIIQKYTSPCGDLVLGTFGDRLCMCDWMQSKKHDTNLSRLSRMLDAEFTEGTSPVIGKSVSQLNEYFAGLRRDFDVPMQFAGTEFQKKVWKTLLTIPYGHTISYGEMARLIGMPSAVRAVAAAVGANAISIIAPCHRIIGRSGSLTGYAGSIEAKRFLLELERQPAALTP